MATITEYILTTLDQMDEDDRLIDEAIVNEAARLARITDRRLLKDFADQNSGMSLPTTNDSRYVTLAMDDLFAGDPATDLERKEYFFAPPVYIHSTGRRVMVNGTVVTTGFTFDERSCTVSFTAQQSSGAVVTVAGLIVDFSDLMSRVLGEIESRLAMTPDVHGARHQEWQKRVALYRRKTYGMQLP